MAAVDGRTRGIVNESVGYSSGRATAKGPKGMIFFRVAHCFMHLIYSKLFRFANQRMDEPVAIFGKTP